MPVKLSVERQTLSFNVDAIGIGRDPDNQISLPNDTRLAPMHAILRCVNDRWIIESRDGGPVRIGNGRPSQFAWLKPGDVIHLTEAGPELIFEPFSVSPAEIISRAIVPEQLPTSKAPASTSAAVPYIPFIPDLTDKKAKPERVKSIKSQSAVLPKKTAEGPRGTKFAPIYAIEASLLVMLALAGWAVVSWGFRPAKTVAVVQEPDQMKSELTSPEQVPPPRPEQLPNSEKVAVDPREFLVLIGFGNLKSDDRPHVLGVGWLWDERTAVTSVAVGDAIKEIVKATLSEGAPLQGCVIQGLPVEIGEVVPAGFADITILRLNQSAELSIAARDQWKKTNASGIERQRRFDKPLTYFSYEKLPRPASLTGTHGFPLCEYDPENCRLNHEKIRVEYQQPEHYIKSVNLERGGLIVDEDQKIVGMAPLNSPIIWTEVLERALIAR